MARRAFPPRCAGGVLSSSSSISAGPRQASTASATATTNRRRSACCRSIPAFLAGMNLVVLADDAFTFLVSWEFMSLSSWALVMAHHRDRRQRARRLRLSRHGELRHARAAARRSACWPGRSGGYAFRRDARSASDRSLPALVLILALLGAGSKAGLVPLHVWLPLAHPAAPSHVSALMSGVMTKVAVYGFIRIVFDLLGPPQWWWSVPVLMLGGATAVIGVLSAVLAERPEEAPGLQHDREYRHHVRRARPCARLQGERDAGGSRARHDRGAVPRPQSQHLQEPAVLRFRRRTDGDRRARHGASWRPHPAHAAHRLHVPCRMHGDLGPAAAQRLRLGVAHLPGDPPEPGPAAMGPEVPGARGRRDARVVGGARRGLLRQGVRRRPSSGGRARPLRQTRTRSTAGRSRRCSFSQACVC